MSGFSLIELLLVVSIVALLAGFVLSFAFSHTSEAGGGETLMSSLSGILQMRRADALRLNSLETVTSLETSIAPPIEVDFLNLETTRELITDGVDRNADHKDDYTGQTLTYLVADPSRPGYGSWVYSFEGQALKLPPGWHIVSNTDDLAGRPPLGNSSVLATCIAFNNRGQALGKAPGQNSFSAQPNPALSDSFWAVYAVYQDGKSAVAIAVYPSGLIEGFRLDGTEWRGFARRAL